MGRDVTDPDYDELEYYTRQLKIRENRSPDRMEASKGESPGSILETSNDTPTRTIFACALCEKFIDGDEVVVRTNVGWLPYHPACAPDPQKFHYQLRIRGGC